MEFARNRAIEKFIRSTDYYTAPRRTSSHTAPSTAAHPPVALAGGPRREPDDAAGAPDDAARAETAPERATIGMRSGEWR